MVFCLMGVDARCVKAGGLENDFQLGLSKTQGLCIILLIGEEGKQWQAQQRSQWA